MGNWARNSGLAPLFRSMMKSMISLLLITHFLNKRLMISVMIIESSVMAQKCLNRTIIEPCRTGIGLAQDTDPSHSLTRYIVFFGFIFMRTLFSPIKNLIRIQQ
jgi:hypothetical protein